MQARERATVSAERVVPVCRTVLAVAHETQLTLMAASLAYYLFSALLPLVLFAVMSLSALGDGSLQWAMDLASGTLVPRGTGLPRGVLRNAGGQLRAAAIGGVILAWSAFRTFGALDGAFAAVYDTREHVSLAGRVLDSALVLVTVAFATAAMALIGVALVLVAPDRVAVRVLSPLFLLVTLIAAFFPTFGYYLKSTSRSPTRSLERSLRVQSGRSPPCSFAFISRCRVASSCTVSPAASCCCFPGSTSRGSRCWWERR